MNSIKIIVISAIICTCLSACSGDEEPLITKEELIEQRIEEKLANWEKVMRQKCEKDVLEAAEIIADSTLIAQARLDKVRPEKPIKPEVPEVMELKDTVPVQPILRDSN